jgi:hypothetical protein
MEERREGVAFPPRAMGAAEGQMVRVDLVREIVARRERGKARDRSRESWRWIARRCGVGCEFGGWQPRQGGGRPRAIDPYLQFIERRGPEVGWNGVVLHRELAALGFSGSYQQVQRLLKSRRDRRRWQEAATVRFETEPGTSRLRPAPGLDRGATRDGSSVRIHAGLFAALVYPRASQLYTRSVSHLICRASGP